MNKFKGNYVQDWIEDTCEYDFERIRNEKIIKNGLNNIPKNAIDSII